MPKKRAKKKSRRTIPKSKDNLQTVIVSKRAAPTRGEATKIARDYARKIYTSRETKTSWRFRQRPPEDFRKGSFRTFRVPKKGVSLVYGTLKKGKKNPEIDYKKELKVYRKLFSMPDSAQNVMELAEIAKQAHEKLSSPVLIDQMDFQISKNAGRLGYRKRGDIHEVSRQIREYGQRELFENPSLKKMPDPGACAWLGDLIEWKWADKKDEWLWESNGEKWLFLWSPDLKAVIGVPNPKKKKKLNAVSRKDGAAKITERFKARAAESTHEISIPKVPLKNLGTAVHIVYRSDKWNPGHDVDYIHDFKDGVQLYCGPTLKNPQVFLCMGGKLTVTERGLVF